MIVSRILSWGAASAALPVVAATPVLYNDRSAFTTDLDRSPGVALQLFDFDSSPVLDPGSSVSLLAPGISVGAATTLTGPFDLPCVFDTVYDYEGGNVLRGPDAAWEPVRFSFATPVAAFGLDLVDMSLFGDQPNEKAFIHVEFADNTSVIYNRTAAANDRIPFWGVTYAPGIASVAFWSTYDVDSSSELATLSGTVWLDNATVGPAVPEPAAAGLLVASGIMLAFRPRRYPTSLSLAGSGQGRG